MIEKLKEYLKGKLPNSQFTVYDDYTVLQLIWKLIIPSMNFIIDDNKALNENLNKKVSFQDMEDKYHFKNENGTEDYQGSWHGISKPQFAEPGIAGVVDSLVTKVTTLMSKILYVDIRSFGAKCDGVTDDTKAFKDAIAYIKNNGGVVNRFMGGKTLLIPNGITVVSDLLTIDFSGITIKGESLNSTILVKGENKTLFSISGSDVSNLYNVNMSNFTVVFQRTTDGGGFANINNLINSVFENIVIWDSFKGFTLDKLGKIHFNNIKIEQSNYTLNTSYTFDFSNCADIYIDSPQLNNKKDKVLNGNSMIIRSCDGLYFSNGHQHGGLVITPNPNSAETLASVYFDRYYFDTSISACVTIGGSTSMPYRNIQFNNCYFRDGVNGVDINTSSTLDLVSFIGCSFSQNNKHGLRVLQNTKNVNIVGCTFASNNMGNNLDGADLKVSTDKVNVKCNQFCGGSTTSGTKAIELSGRYHHVSDNNLFDSNYPLKIVDTSTLSVIRNNSGTYTRVKGSVNMTAAATSVVVTPGVSMFTNEQIIITPRTNMGNYWISNVTDTTFTVNFATSTQCTFTYIVDKEI